MTYLTQNFEALLQFLLVAVLPFVAAWLLCKSLRVREHGFRLGWVLFFIMAALLPFLARMFHRDRYVYQNPSNLKWVAASEVTESRDAATGQTSGTDKTTGQPLVQVPVSLNDLQYSDGAWKYVVPPVTPRKGAAKDDKAEKPELVEAVNRFSFEPWRWKQALNFGIDLAGGTNLIYEVEEKDPSGEPLVLESDLMDRMVGAVQKRVNPDGTKEIVVRRVGERRIEIILPGADQGAVEQIKQQITELGSLEFSILANRRDHAALINQAEGNPAKKIQIGETQAQWMPVAADRDQAGRPIPNTEFDRMGDIAIRQIAGRPAGFKEVLVVYEAPERRVTGQYLRRSYVTRSEQGRPSVGFQLKAEGGRRFLNLTTRNAPRQDGSKRNLAVLLNGEIQTAPNINSPIETQGVIESDRFTLGEVQKYVDVLNAGALPVPLKKAPISEFTISPTLGADVQSKGRLALIVSSLAVIAFMWFYYRSAGLIANFALLLNLLFIVASMVYLKAAFTLPGLAGLVLSAGMAVDANVLIYERMREELQRGASLRMAIHNGFDKAFVAIFDSNITTLITAMILFLIGTEQVKGFAVALFIGLVMNLYTAVYVSRMIFNILERSGLMKKVNFMNAIGLTKIDFVSKQNLAIAASALLIGIGLLAFFARGTRNYDIDFTGGMSVTMQFNEPQQTETVRQKLEQAFGTGNITVEELSPSADIAQGTFFRFRLANEGETLPPASEIESKVNGAFPNQLVRRTMQMGELKQIAAAEKTDADAGPADPFAGGTTVSLKFGDAKGGESRAAEIAPSTLLALLNRKLGAIPAAGDAGGLKYPRPEGLLELEGTAGSGLQVSGSKSRTYSALDLKAAAGLNRDDLKQVLGTLSQEMQEAPVFDEVTSFESSVAREARYSALIAILASLLAIVAYVWFRFENLIFGLAAVVALAHDVLVTLAMIAIASYLSKTPIGGLFLFNDFKINMPMIAAFLTIVGYSLNDTIVIFDRLREVRGKNPHITRDMINDTVNQTLSRTILTALTVFITVLILYVLGGEGIHGFAFAMLIGTIAGTYSTIYIASPLVLWFADKFAPKAGQRAKNPSTQSLPQAKPA